MKYIRPYKSNEPKVGDYVVISADSMNKEYNDFINNTIGKMYKKSKNFIYIRYDYIPYGIRQWFTRGETTSAELEDIVYFGKTKEDVEIKMNSNKYNI